MPNNRSQTKTNIGITAVHARIAPEYSKASLTGHGNSFESYCHHANDNTIIPPFTIQHEYIEVTSYHRDHGEWFAIDQQGQVLRV